MSFEFSKKDKTLAYYHVILFYNKNINKLIETIKSKIGKPVYVPGPFEGDTLPDAFLWEDKTSFYTLSGVTQNQADFIVFKKNDLTVRKQMLSAGNFQYYGDYLEYLEEKNKTNKQISYYQYAKLIESEGSDFYIDDYVKP